jgi:hypothetical protein
VPVPVARPFVYSPSSHPRPSVPQSVWKKAEAAGKVTHLKGKDVLDKDLRKELLLKKRQRQSAER